eukprot:Rhum_TRINITY_DN12061_c0_g1::Rhum_TRINITY_DN12061_c0_g1_i1::g.48696::m.48696/K07542/PIGV; phosphatidylinositol glycan, class V
MLACAQFQAWVFAAFVRLCVVAASVAADAAVSDYDESDAASLEGCAVRGLAHWDGVFFRHVAANAGYTYEHFTAFQPLYPAVVRALSHTLSAAPSTCVYATVGVVVSNAAFVASAHLFDKTAREVLRLRHPALASVAYCLSPCGVFLSATYSESLYLLLALAVMYLFMKDGGRASWPTVAAASSLLTLATLTRMNGVVLAGYGAYAALQCRSPGRLAAVLAAFVPVLAYQRWVWGTFCDTPLLGSDDAEAAAEHAALCEVPFYALYGHVQDKYWGVGFLRYFTLKQAPNFALATPIAGVAFLAVVGEWRRVAAEGPAARCVCRLLGVTRVRGREEAAGDARVVMTIHLAFMLAVGVFASHVQIMPRLLAGCLPLYWTLGDVLAEGTQLQKRAVCTYLVGWQVAGCWLFSNFYPWT